MVCENVNVGAKAKLKLSKWDEEISFFFCCGEEEEEGKNYNNVQVIFIRVETEKRGGRKT